MKPQKTEFDRAVDLVSMLSRPTSSEGEVMNAARALGRLVQRVGGPDQLLRSTRPTASLASTHMSFNEARRAQSAMETENTALKQTVARLANNISQLTTENADLRTQLDAMKGAMKTKLVTSAAKADGAMAYDEFAARVQLLLGNKGWKGAFVSQMGLDERVLERARRNGMVSKDLVDLLPKIKTKQRVAFSPNEVKEIREWADSEANEEIAKRASVLFGRIITESMITKLRSNLRNNVSPYDSEAYGGPLPVPSQRNAPFPWTDHPELEEEICRDYLSKERKSAAHMARYVSKKTGIPIKDGTIKQRLNNAPPPESMVRGLTYSGPITWLELWALGAKIDKRAWRYNVFNALGIPSLQIGEKLHDLPILKIEALRDRLVRNHHVKSKRWG